MDVSASRQGLQNLQYDTESKGDVMVMKNRYYRELEPGVVEERKTLWARWRSRSWWRLISGLPLPKDEDGVVRNIEFVECTFHPNCSEVKFEGCTFVRCRGMEYLHHRGGMWS